jgi:sugar/nucleoside kinase (ribokinase family)
VIDAIGPRELVIKRGARGATWTDGERTLDVDARPADGRDTTGAGDAFAAGFLAARAREATPEVCLRDGHALAAAACRTTGGRPEA